LIVALACVGVVYGADEPKADGPPRQIAGTCETEKGTILRRQGAPGQPWHLVDAKEAIAVGDLLVGLPGAEVASRNGAVRLVLMTDLSGLSPYPIRENAVRLHDTPGVDLDVTLERGQIILVNRRVSGSAQVRVRVRQETWDLVLDEPGASMALELYGRWPRGTSFTKTPGPKDVPNASLVFLVLKGEVTLKHHGVEHALKAPPGPAMIEWDSVTGHDETPERLQELPPWVGKKNEDTPLARMKKETLQRCRQSLLDKGVEATLDDFVNSDNPADRRLAVFAMGALDDLPRLGKALREAKQLDVWDNGVLALRHWIGRGPGQDQRLYEGLLKTGNFSPVDAETVMELLHSYGNDDLARPETYQTLIDYLDHDKLAIRGLAHWHLCRLVPDGDKCGYNPLDDKEKRAAAVQKWRKLVPMGQVPPRPKADEKKKESGE
jgi:hypothetical protein